MAMEMVLKEHRLSKDGAGDGLEAKRFELHVEDDSSYEQASSISFSLTLCCILMFHYAFGIFFKVLSCKYSCPPI